MSALSVQGISLQFSHAASGWDCSAKGWKLVRPRQWSFVAERSLRRSPRSHSFERRSDMTDYLPHTQEEVSEMLEFLGLDSLDDLFAHIPAAVRLAEGLDLPAGMSEPDVAAQFAEFTAANVAKAGT